MTGKHDIPQPPTPQDDAPRKRFLGLSAFDWLVGGVALGLLLVLALLTLLSNPARRGPLVAYLYPLGESVQNIWVAPVDDPSQAQQVTDAPLGVYDYEVSPDGRFIAYSARNPDNRLLDIFRLDLQTGNVEQLTNCAAEDAECYTPIFHPDGTIIAYLRQSLNRTVDSVGPGVPRVWLMDISAPPYESRALSEDSQLIGHSPQWSDDGNTIAFYSADVFNPGILVYNFRPPTDDQPALHFIPSAHGSVGSLSPNGRQLVFPDIVDRGGSFFTHLKIVDLNADPPEYTDFTDEQGPTDDIGADWHPDGQHVTIERRYTDERYTRGYQLYQVDIQTGDMLPLLVDERYSHHYFAWNPAGDHLLVQRIPLLDEDGEVNRGARPEVWVLNYETGELTRISELAYFPRWVIPGGG